MFSASIASAGTFKEEVAFVSRAVPKQGFQGGRWLGPAGQCRIVLSTVKGILRLTASDMELQATRGIGLRKQHGELNVAVKPSDLQAALKGLQSKWSELAISFDDTVLLVAGKSVPWSEPEAALFPEDEEIIFSVDRQYLRMAFAAVEPALSRDETRPVLTGAGLKAGAEGVALAATDTYRLTVYDLKSASGGKPGEGVWPERSRKVIVPGNLIRLYLTMKGDEKGYNGCCPATVAIGEKTITLRTDSVMLTARLVDGEYPNYDRIIPPSCETTRTIAASILAEVAKAVKPIADMDSERMELRFDGVTLEAKSFALVGDTVCNCTATRKCGQGDVWSQTFNVNQFADAATMFGMSEVRIGSNGSGSPICMTAPEFLGVHVLMPMQPLVAKAGRS